MSHSAAVFDVAIVASCGGGATPSSSAGAESQVSFHFDILLEIGPESQH